MTIKEQIKDIIKKHNWQISIRTLRVTLGGSQENLFSRTLLVEALEELAEDYIEEGLLVDTDKFNYVRVLTSSKREIFKEGTQWVAQETLVLPSRDKIVVSAFSDSEEQALKNLEDIL